MNQTEVREYHYLRQLKSTQTPANLLFLDTETYAVNDTRKKGRTRHHLRLWCAEALRLEKGVQSRQVQKYGKTADEFWRFVASRTDNKRPLWIFCHNAGFDMTVLDLWQQAADGFVDFVQRDITKKSDIYPSTPITWTGVAVLDDPPTILKFRLAGSRRTIVVVDTYNYFRSSLAEIGDSIGMDKGQLPPADAPETVWQDYCCQDVAVLKSAVMSLIQLVTREELGGMAYTISGLAWNAYRKRFLPNPKAILIHGNGDALKLERESYHGGTCQLWYKGMVCSDRIPVSECPAGNDSVPWQWGEVYHLDVQSFYPSIMREYQFPCRLKCVTYVPSLSQLEAAIAAKCCIASVWLDCGPPGFPVTRKGKTFYATGRFFTVLPYPELYRAWQEGAIKKHGVMAEYETDYLFREFVDYFYQLRREYALSDNPAFAYASKLILNSLYGKFGQHRWKWQEDKEAIAPIPYGTWFERHANEEETRVYRALGWLPQLQQGRAEHPDSFPAIPSFVTSYGRELILRYAQIAMMENCLYSDTDSLHVLADGYENLKQAGLVQPGQIGRLELKEKWPWVVYRGVKNYQTPGGNVIAGIKSDAVQVSGGSFRQTRFQRLASVLAGDCLDSIAVEDVTVQIAQYYPLGQVDNQGRVSPPQLCEW